jgi:outer membrane protein
MCLTFTLALKTSHGLRISRCALLALGLNWIAFAQQERITQGVPNEVTLGPSSQSSLQTPVPPVTTQSPSEGPLYLSLQQAIQLALKNNLDIQLEQLDQTVADLSLKRTQGGSTPLAINYSVAEAPAGEGTSSVPLLSSSSSLLSPASVDPAGINISSSYDTAHVMESQRSLALSTNPLSAGPPIPAFDAELLGQFGWLRRNPSGETVSATAGSAGDTATVDNTLANTTLLKAFSSGTSIQLGVNNFVQSFYSGRSSAVPFTRPNVIAMVAQPLLRGFGRSVNTRYIAIAKTNKMISSAILEEQMISTISGVESLYYDLLSLQDAVTVQEKALRAAEDLLSNDREQLAVGRMAPIEVSRAEALVTADRLGLTQTTALRDQQRLVLRSVLDPQSLTRADVLLSEIIATDELAPPANEAQVPVADMIKSAWEQRPDLRQAKLQVSNGERMLAGAQNAVRPELDLYGTFESRGVIIPGLLPVGGDPITGAAVQDSVPSGGIRSSRVYEAGIQFNLPLQNRVAKADLAADRVQLQQQRTRLTQMQAQTSAEVRNAVIGLAAARQAAEAAVPSRKLQEQLLGAEMEKFLAGRSTNFAVIQQQAYLAQAQTTEVVAKAAWNKAAVQLNRAIGSTLERNGMSLNVATPKAVQ